MKKISILWLLTLSSFLCFAADNRQQDSGSNSVKQDWVVPMSTQIRKAVWNGSKFMDISQIEKEFDEYLFFKKNFGVGKNVFMVNGRFMLYENIRDASPDAYRRILDLDQLKFQLQQVEKEINSLVKSLEDASNEDRSNQMYLTFDDPYPPLRGELFQHIGSNVILMKVTGEENPLAVRFTASQKILNISDGKLSLVDQVADGELISVEAVRTGSYQYKSVQGANMTVKSYRALNENEIKIIEQERAKARAQLERKQEKIRSEKLALVKKKRDDLLSNQSKLMDQKRKLEIEIQKWEKLMPQQIDLNNFAQSFYYRGLEADLVNKMIIPSSSCEPCTGKGKLECQFCKGTGKTSFYDEDIDVIKKGSLAHNYYRREMFQALRNVRRTRINPSYVSTGIQQSDTSKRQQKLDQVLQSRQRRGTLDCPVCDGKGWSGCHKCVLIDKPTYRESAKDEYLKRLAEIKFK